MNSSMKIRKIGKFYNVFDDDCYILYYLFDYKIKQNRTGFPSSAYNKVINKLEEQMIDYEIIGEGIKISFKKKNNYDKYVESGKDKYERKLKRQNLEGQLEKLSEQELKELYKIVEGYISAREVYNS